MYSKFELIEYSITPRYSEYSNVYDHRIRTMFSFTNLSAICNSNHLVVTTICIREYIRIHNTRTL